MNKEPWMKEKEVFALKTEKRKYQDDSCRLKCECTALCGQRAAFPRINEKNEVICKMQLHPIWLRTCECSPKNAVFAFLINGSLGALLLEVSEGRAGVQVL